MVGKNWNVRSPARQQGQLVEIETGEVGVGWQVDVQYLSLCDAMDTCDTTENVDVQATLGNNILIASPHEEKKGRLDRDARKLLVLR